MKSKLSLVLLCITLLTGCATDTEEQTVVTVSAAASLSDVLQDIATHFQAEYPMIDVQYNFGASGTLKEQIEQGAPVDVFISASPEKFDELEMQNLVAHRRNLVRNELVLITSVQQAGVTTFHDLVNDDIEKIALGTPDSVPAGQYGQQALHDYGVLDRIQPKIVYAKDVRQVLTYVETNNAQAGIVYKTDALISEKVRIVQTAKQGSHEAIIYPAGVVASTNINEEAHAFLDYLVAEDIQPIWQQYGFEME